MDRNYYLFENFIDKNGELGASDYEKALSSGYINYTINWEVCEEGVKVIPAGKESKKDKTSTIITFKLGYLAVLIKYENLYKPTKDKFFIKFSKSKSNN